MEIPVRGDRVAERRVRRGARQRGREGLPLLGALGGKRAFAPALEGPAARVRELGREEGGVEARVRRRRLPVEGADRREQVLRLVQETAPLGGRRGLAKLDGEVPVAQVLDERRPEVGVVGEERRDPDAGRGERGADAAPPLLGGRSDLRVEDEDGGRPAPRPETEVATRADVPRQRRGAVERTVGKVEPGDRGREPLPLAVRYRAVSSTDSSTFRIFW